MSHRKFQRTSSLNKSKKQLKLFTDILTNSESAKKPTATTSKTANKQPGSKTFCKQLSQQSWSTQHGH